MIWTPRQRKYLRILKHRRMNNSRPVLYPPGTLVKLRGNRRAGSVFVVDHNSGADTCHLKQEGYEVAYPEKAVRRLTFGEFLWYKDPTTGGMKIGKNRAVPILLWLGIMLASSAASIVGVEGGLRWAWPVITVLSIAGVLAATYANFRDRQA